MNFYLCLLWNFFLYVLTQLFSGLISATALRIKVILLPSPQLIERGEASSFLLVALTTMAPLPSQAGNIHHPNATYPRMPTTFLNQSAFYFPRFFPICQEAPPSMLLCIWCEWGVRWGHVAELSVLWLSTNASRLRVYLLQPLWGLSPFICNKLYLMTSSLYGDPRQLQELAGATEGKSEAASL